MINNVECTICLKEIKKNPCILKNCSHQFHKDCIVTWCCKEGQKNSNRCPNCRTQIQNSWIKTVQRRQRCIDCIKKVALCALIAITTLAFVLVCLSSLELCILFCPIIAFPIALIMIYGSVTIPRMMASAFKMEISQDILLLLTSISLIAGAILFTPLLPILAALCL